jgi:hypothetical protein
MNSYQKVWWKQAKSDHDAFLLIRRQGIAQCHLLHYLQMVTEKIAKAYFWRSGTPALASNGPNPEYPWPHAQPQIAPVGHNFPIWPILTSGYQRPSVVRDFRSQKKNSGTVPEFLCEVAAALGMTSAAVRKAKSRVLQRVQR